MMTQRPTWDEYFVQIAQQIATRSTCPRASVGAVVVRDQHILSHGYNGSPRGLPHCTDVGCLIYDQHCRRIIHAEVNAILMAGDTSQTTLYTTHLPCLECCMVIQQTGIARIVYAEKYFDGRTYLYDGTGCSSQLELLMSRGLDVVQVEGQNVSAAIASG